MKRVELRNLFNFFTIMDMNLHLFSGQSKRETSPATGKRSLATTGLQEKLGHRIRGMTAKKKPEMHNTYARTPMRLGKMARVVLCVPLANRE